MGRRWKPILDIYDENGVDLGYEIHPGEDVFDSTMLEMFVDAVGGHERAQINYDPSHFVLQQLDYLDLIDIYHDRICAHHIKDAEFNPKGLRVSIPVTRVGQIAQADSGLWAMVRQISQASLAKWHIASGHGAIHSGLADARD